MIESAVISSCDNQKIKNIRKLRKKKYRTIQNAYIIESIKLFKEAIQWHIPILQIYYTQLCIKRNPELKKLLVDLGEKDISVYEVSEKVFRNISEFQTPEGILCIVEKQEHSIQNIKRILILDDIQDPGNTGTMIRTADAAGFNAVLCSEHTIDIYDSKVIRATMGSFFHIPIIQSKDILSDVKRLKNDNVLICGTALEGKESYHCPISSVDKIALILGSESHGMSQMLKDQCDILWKLPIRGKAESLNVSVAAGVFMYKISEFFF